MGILTNLTLDDVDIDNKKPAFVHSINDSVHQVLTAAPGGCIHGVFHHVRPLLVNPLEF